jgi:integrase/recombinase XerC
MCNYCARVGGVKVNNQHADKYADLDQSTLYPFIGKFLNVMLARGIYRQSTVKGVRSDLCDLAAEFGRRPLNQFGPLFIEEWMDPRKRPLSDNTRRNRLSHAKSFSAWLAETGKVKDVATRKYPRIKVEPQPIVTCTPEEVVRLFEVVAGDRRGELIVWLMFRLACRCCEVSRLRIENYNPRVQELTVTGKRDKRRDLPVLPEVVPVLDAYLDDIGRPPTGPLIRSSRHAYSGLTAGTISTYVARWMREAGITGRRYNTSAHALRRTAASDVMESPDGDIYVVQEMLGHENIETTTIYLRKVSKQRLREAMSSRPPLPMP